MDTIDSNILMHTAAAVDYREFETQYRKENIKYVREYIKMLKRRTKGKRLLDVGCGQGFIIDIAKDYFPYIRGIDITPAMLEKVNLNPKNKCNIAVSIAKAEHIPYKDESFDACTCYNVLHHLKNPGDALKEICRILKKGGMLFTGLDPNFYFWDTFSKLNSSGNYSPFVRREIDAVQKKPDELEKKYGISKKIILTAMRCKYIKRGFKPEDLSRIISNAGFSRHRIEYTWYVGQGNVINNRKLKKYATVIDGYLREILPLSRSLFKYLNIIAVK